MITSNHCSPIKEQTFDDSLLFFGSTGLIGSITLEYFTSIDLYLHKTGDLQSKVRYLNENVYNVTVNKTFYCINRKFSTAKNSSKNEYIVNRNSETTQIMVGRENFFLKDDTSSSPPQSQSTNISSKNSTSMECGKIAVNCASDFYGTTINYRLNKIKHQLEFLSEHKKTLSITYQILVVELEYVNSSAWGELLPLIFCGNTRLTPFNNVNSLMPNELPKIGNISTMICTLGSNANQAAKDKRNKYYVDYNLTLHLVRKFTTCKGKRLVVITSFNNALIRHIFPYFKTKSKLEFDLQHRIIPKLTYLAIIRPGPLVGTHSASTKKTVALQKSSNLPKQLFFYQKFCWDYKHKLLKDFSEVGFKTKASEMLARTMYRRPGSWLLGYCVPASKTALIVAIKAIQPAIDPLNCSYETISSQELDYLV